MLTKTGNANIIQKLFVFLSFLLSADCFATGYYVSSTGNDANSGNSISDAWATISKVNSMVFLPGDALYFEGGQTFSGSILLNSSDANDPNNLFIVSTYGTGRATINAGTSYGFYAYNTQGISISNLIFDGNSTGTNTDAGVKIFSDLPGDIKFSNISLSHIEVKNFGGEGVKIYTSKNLTGYQNVSLSNLSVHDVLKNGIIVFGFVSQTLVGWQHKNISVSNCEVYHVPGSLVPAILEGNGIVLSGVDGGVIEHCVAHDNGQNNPFCGGPAGIWTLESNNIRIEYCESYRNHSGTVTGCDGAGFDLDGGVTNSIMQYNYSHDNDGAGYLMGEYPNARPWSNNTMRYNISENDAITNEGGIGLFKGPGTTMSGANIYNNTIFVSPQIINGRECAAYLQNWNTGIDNVVFYNNIFITTGGVPLVNIPTGYDAFFAGNLYWSSGNVFSVKYHGITYSSLASWRTATNNELVNGINTGYNGDPLVANPGLGGVVGFGNSLSTLNAYKISNPLSPAFETALDLWTLYAINVGSTDFWGTVLPGGAGDDIGANQSSSSPLPIELLGFHGNCSGLAHNISWTTGVETNIKSFDLLYSGDGMKFRNLATVMPRGSNSDYHYVNDSISAENNYYQLRMTDLDGSITYSAVLKLACGVVSNKIHVWPNPFSQSIHVSIESKSTGVFNMTLYDVMGKMLLQRKVSIQQGNNQVGFDGAGDLPAGAYYLQIVHPDHIEHFKLIKANN